MTTQSRQCVIVLYWMSADASGEILMGTYPSEEAATAAIPAATAELLAECATDQERDNIRAGSLIISIIGFAVCVTILCTVLLNQNR